MTEEYILKRDIIGDHRERMANLKKYYPYFKLVENGFSQYQGGRYEILDMGYILMAVLRFFIEENNFREKDVTYEEYSSFIKEIYERDFGLKLEKAEEQSLSLYIFDKLRNEGKPFVFSYFSPEEGKKKSSRIRFIESRIKEDIIYYYITGEAIEFYLDTKEIKDESTINVSQLLLAKMITSKNFKGGIEVVRRINNQVVRLQMKREEVLELLNSDVFQGIKAYEEFMETGVKWFQEEQKMFAKNMELIQEALKKADSESAYGQTMKDIYYLENELKRALVNHSELLNTCTKLQVQADEIVAKAKFSRLKKNFDFKDMMRIAMKENNAIVFENLVNPIFRLNVKKRFSLTNIDKMLTLRPEREEKGESIRETEEVEYISEDEAEEERIKKNYVLYIRLLLYYVSVKECISVKELTDYFEEVLGSEVLKNSDFYSFLVHFSQKNYYNIEEIMTKPDTFLEEYMLITATENPQYQMLSFAILFEQEDRILIGEDYEISNFIITRNGD